MTLGKINIKTDDIENSYVEATIIIDGIKKENKESKCKYSYYIRIYQGSTFKTEIRTTSGSWTSAAITAATTFDCRGYTYSYYDCDCDCSG